MSKIDRSKFQATSSRAIKDQEKAVGNKRNFFSNKGDRTIYHKIDSGENLFRIYPFHPDAGGKSFAEAKCTAFLSIEVDEYDEEGNETGKKIIRRKPVFNAKIHSDVVKKDIVDEYMTLFKKKIENDFESDAERKEEFAKATNWQTGIKPTTSWVMYADKYVDGKPIFGILEVTNGVKEQINKVSAIEDENDPLSSDPFSDPDDGVKMVIKKSGKNLDTEYLIELESRRKGKHSIELIPTPLTDEQLDRFMECESLYKKFKNVYNRKDFEMQLEGIQRFDELHDVGIFESEEFMALCEEISNIVPDAPKKDNDGQAESKKEGGIKNQKEEESKDSDDESDDNPYFDENESEDDTPDWVSESEDEESEDEPEPPKKESAKDRLARLRGGK